MALALQTAPTLEPVSVIDAKRYWAIDHGEDDDRVSLCISAGRIWCEHFLGRALVNRTYALYLRSWSQLGCPDSIRLPYPPLSSVTSITYTGTDNSAFGSTMSSGDYTVETWREPGRIVLDDDASWPTLYGHGTKDEVKVLYVAGSGATAALVLAAKPNIINAILDVGRTFYENPGLMGQSPAGANNPYRNEVAEALLWSDRFLGEVDGL